MHVELTSQQAADILNVSQPFLIELLESDQIAFRNVGKHRVIKFEGLIKYKREIDLKRMDALNELAKQAQELDMGY